MARLVVTGATGFIGWRLAQIAAARGWQVVALGLVRSPVELERRQDLEASGIVVHTPDLAIDDVSGLLAPGDTIVHLAAAQHEMNIPDERFRAINVEAVRQLLATARRRGVARFVHGSTIGVYGPRDEVLDEKSEPAPDNIYGRTKLAGEELVRAAGAELPVAIVRIAETYGPGDQRLLKLFRAAAQGKFPLLGGGRNRHHPIHVDDLVEGILLACTHPAAVGELFVLAGPEIVTTRQMLEAVAAAVGRADFGFELPLWPFALAAGIFERTLRPLGIQPPLHRRRLDFFTRSFAFRTDKAERLLGWHPGISFAEGARQTARWYAERGWLQTGVSSGPASVPAPDAAPTDAESGQAAHAAPHR